MRIVKNSFLLCLLLSLGSCSGSLCGDLDVHSKKLLDATKANYRKILTIEYTPCEFNYINIYMLTDSIDPATLDAIHSSLYDQSKNIGWVTIDVYDSKRSYRCSHGLKGNSYVRKGD